MDLDPILSALSKLEQSINNRYNDLNDKYQLVNTQLDALNVKLDNYPDKFQQVNTKLEEFNNKLQFSMKKLILSYQLPMTFTPLLQLSMLQLQILLKRQNGFPLKRCYKHGNPTAKIIT